MNVARTHPAAAQRHINRWLGVAGALLAIGIVAGCSSANKAAETTATAPPSAAARAGSPAAPGTAGAAGPAQATPVASGPAQQNLRLLKVSPDNGPIGTAFTLSSEGLPGGADLTVNWATVDGRYDTTATPENVTFNSRAFTPKRIPLGTVHVGDGGTASGSFVAPADFGEVHDIYLSTGTTDVAHGGFRVMRQVSISPDSGPIGTPITVSVTGLGWQQYNNTIALRYDNAPTGIITAVTTHGTTSATVRAAGAAGRHVIDIDGGARSVPFLNNQQSGTANIPDWRFWFTVTDDTVLPANSVDIPTAPAEALQANAAPRTTADVSKTSGDVAASIAPSAAPILSPVSITAHGLPAAAPVDLYWVTARGNRTSPSGWALTDTHLASATTGADGSLSAGFSVPDDLGGWHVVKVAQGQTVLAQIPFFVQESLVEVTPQQVKAGDVFTIHIKGVGWTELDNGVSVTYDNGYMGFACGFASNGDVTINLVATGAPGIHLIDLYPMIYQGSHGEAPWGYQEPLLSYRVDTPGLSLGYTLPAFRLAIQVVQ